MNGRIEQELDFDWLSKNAVGPDFIPKLLKIQEATPVFWSNCQQGWVLTRYKDVEAGLRDPRLSNKRTEPYLERALGASIWERYPAFMDGIGRWVFNIDAPEHTRIRRLLIKPFNKGSIERHRGKAQAVLDKLIEEVAERETFDFQKDFALRYTATVLLHTLNLGGVIDVDRVLNWGDIFASAVATADPAQLDLAERATLEMTDLLAHQIDLRRADPGDDLLSELATASDEGKMLTVPEIVSLFQLMLIGGFETTANTLTLAVSALRDKPEHQKYIASNPSELPRVVEELNRYTAMLGTMFRIVKEDHVLHGQSISAGDFVFLMIGAANWDHRVFDNPGQIDFDRKGPQALSFAPGIHMCIGHNLARMQLEVAYGTLYSGSRSVEIEDRQFQYMSNFTARTPIDVKAKIVNIDR